MGQELVVTALGRKKQERSLGYSVQEVQGKSLAKVKAPNVSNSLVGKVAGLDIRPSTDLFQNSSIRLRGRSPLIVIDGVPDPNGDLWKISSDDIAKVSVLKGGAATSLYGSKGQNGAILITTKQGGNEGLHVEFNSSTMAQNGFVRAPHVQTTYGEGDNGQYRYVDGQGGGPEGGGWMWGPKLNRQDPTTDSGYWETVQYNSPIDPETGKRIPIPFISRGENNIQNFFRTGILSTNNLSLSWGGENGNFRASVSNKYQRGIVPNTDLNTTSLMVGGGVNVSDKLTANGSLTYNKEYTHNFPSVGYGPNNYLYNLELWTGADVDVRDLRNYWREGQKGIQQRNPNISYYNNPYLIANEYLRGYYKDNAFGNLNLNYQALPSLSVKFKTGGNVYGLSRSTEEPKSYINYGTKSRGNYYLTNDNYYNINTRLSATYEHDVTAEFSVSAEAGISNNFQNYKSAYVHSDGLVIPEFYSLSNSANPLQGSNRLENQQTNSVYGIVDLSYQQTYYLSLTGRNDWVSTLPVENNSFFYPSVSGSVVLSELLTLPSLMNNVKIRGSWSRVSKGQISSDPYSYIQAYQTGTNWNGNNPSLYLGGELINSNLEPETSDTWETGLTLGLFGDRLSFDVAYYQARDYNNLVSSPVSDASGYTSVLVNGNEYKRKGLEFTIRARPVQSEAFQWNLTTNLSSYHRYLTEIYGGAKSLNRLHAGDRTDRIYANVYATDPRGNIIFKDNGYPKDDSFARFVGYSDPDWNYGLQNSFSYHQFALEASIDGRIGGRIYSTVDQKMWWGGKHPGEVNQYRKDANQGKSTYIGDGVVVTKGKVTYDDEGNIINDTREFTPNKTAINYIAFMKSTSNSMNEHYFYYDATFLKLREVTFTYNFPQKWLDHFFLNTASVSLIGRNLLLWSNMKNVDPDTGSGNVQAPSTRNLGLNINVSF